MSSLTPRCTAAAWPAGVEWLLSKLHAGLSGIIGDEMGLGKTIQAAVFLQQAKETKLTTGGLSAPE